MSEPNPPQPIDVTVTPWHPPGETPPTEAVNPAAPAQRRPWGLLITVALVSLLVGIGGTTAAFLLPDLYDRINPPEYTFNVSVFLRADVTDEQRNDVREALDGIHTLDGVAYESRQQAYENFKRLYRDEPDLVQSVRPDTLPESFRFKTKGEDFDCAVLDPALALPAVDDVIVSGFRDRKTPPKLVTCA